LTPENVFDRKVIVAIAESWLTPQSGAESLFTSQSRVDIAMSLLTPRVSLGNLKMSFFLRKKNYQAKANGR
jgi:hypothetical protein